MAEVNVKIKAQNQTRTGFQQALGDAQRFGTSASGSLKSAFAGVASDIKSSIGGALAGLASLGAIRSIIDQFGRIQDLSEQFGVSAESLQRFGQLASESGSSIDQVASAFSRLIINIQKAQGGTGAQADALRELGLSASELANVSPEQAFLRLADALQKTGKDGASYSAVLDLIGKRNGDLIPLLQQGSSAIQAQAATISVASDEVVAKVDAMADRFQRLGQQLAVGFGPVVALIGEKLLGGFAVFQAAVGKITTSITSSVLAIGEALKGNISGASAIMREEAQRTGKQWEDLVNKLNEINAPAPVRPRGAAAAAEAALEDQNNGRQTTESGTRKGNVIGQQLGPGDTKGIEEAKREREAAARALGPEFGPGTAEAAAGGFRVDAAMFQQQQAEEAARAIMAQQQNAFQGSQGASAFQRIGFATNEFFDTRQKKSDPGEETKKAAKLVSDILQILKKGEPLVLPSSSS